MRRLALLLALLTSVACGSDGSGGGTTTPPTTYLVPALVGADISALERIEQAGGVFRDAGTPGDAIAILRARGANIFRLRLFVNPNGQDVVVNDLAYTIRMAKRVKAAGAKLMLDIHYSDTWADPGHQDVPAAWAALDTTALEQQVELYTANAIAQLKHAGALPDIVQVGNEVDAGMLWPTGRVGGASDTPAQWNRFTLYLKAGIKGVRDSLAAGDDVRVMLHYSLGGSTSGTQWFFDHVASAGVTYDMIGLSWYPWWHGALTLLNANLYATAQRYNKDIMVVETAYPWRAGGWESMVTTGGAMTWAVSPSGQALFMRDLANTVANVPGGHGAGVLWWYPESITVSGLFVWGGGSLALFDASGNVLDATSNFTQHPPD